MGELATRKKDELSKEPKRSITPPRPVEVTLKVAVAGDKEHIDLLSKIADYMESMNYHTQKTADNTHKTAKNTQG